MGSFSFLLMMAKLKICVKYVMKFSVSKTFLHNASENAGIAKQIYQKYIPIHEYVVLYAKSNGNLLNKISAHINERDYKNPDNDPRGPYKTMPCTNKGGAIYSVMTPSGKTITEEWRFKRETYDRLLNDNRLVFPRDGDGKPRYKLFLSERNLKDSWQILGSTFWHLTKRPLERLNPYLEIQPFLALPSR